MNYKHKIIISLIFFSFMIYIIFRNNNIFQYILTNKVYLFFILIFLLASNTFFVILYLNTKHKLINQLLEKDNYINKQQSKIQRIKQTSKRLYEKSKFISMNELLLNLAHQWRQPLSIISLVASSMPFERNCKEDIKGLEKDAQIICENTKYLSQMLDSLNNFNNTTLKDKFTLFELLEDLNVLILKYLRTKEIDVIIKLDKDFTVHGYKNEILQVLLNIITNSKEAFVDKDIPTKKIYIDMIIKDDTYEISIKDNAGGVEQKILDRLCEPYFTTKHKRLGTGLGLYYSYINVENKLHGKMDMQNVSYYDDFKYKGLQTKIILPINI